MHTATTREAKRPRPRGRRSRVCGSVSLEKAEAAHPTSIRSPECTGSTEKAGSGLVPGPACQPPEAVTIPRLGASTQITRRQTTVSALPHRRRLARAPTAPNGVGPDRTVASFKARGRNSRKLGTTSEHIRKTMRARRLAPGAVSVGLAEKRTRRSADPNRAREL